MRSTLFKFLIIILLHEALFTLRWKGSVIERTSTTDSGVGIKKDAGM